MKKLLSLGMLGYVGYDYTTPERMVQRSLRTLKAGAVIMYNYKWRFSPDCVDTIHEDTAYELYNMCKENDGLYVKFGQSIAASEHMLPPAYSHWFSKLQDQAKSVNFKAVRRIIKEDLGKEVEDLFASFEEEPIASASIAQVHRAVLKTGERVAVKIQKPNIKKQFNADMFMHWLFLEVLERSFDLPLTSFHKSVEENLRKEIDFNIEAKNAMRCKADFTARGRNDLYVPKIFNDFTSERTLVMEWIDGVKITDEAELQKQGFNITNILTTTIEAFAEQIFISGFAHADPHPGNLFVRRNPLDKKQEQVVLLDYGLCVDINENFRKQYCKFWKSLFLQDTAEIKSLVKEWGGQDEEAFASAQLMRPYSKNTPVMKKLSKTDVYELQMKFKGDFRKILGDTSKFPEDLIFIARNMNLVRSINKRLGSRVNRINLMAKYAVKGLDENNNTMRKRLSVMWFQARLGLSSIIYSLVQLYLRKFSGSSFEQVLEDETKKLINQRYLEYGMAPPDESTFNA